MRPVDLKDPASYAGALAHEHSPRVTLAEWQGERGEHARRERDAHRRARGRAVLDGLRRLIGARRAERAPTAVTNRPVAS